MTKKGGVISGEQVVYRRNFAELECLAPFWCKEFKSKVVDRQGVEAGLLAQYQRQTVRYSVSGSLEDGGKLEGSASHQGWFRKLSEQCQQQYAVHYRRSQAAGYGRSPSSPYDNALPKSWERLPHNIRMEITQAPAEFACPVKQDKRLSPDFKVKVTLKYPQGADVYLPVTMKAIVIPADQYSQMCTWIPPELGSEDKQLSSYHHDKKFQVPLKGTDTVHHVFSTENIYQNSYQQSGRGSRNLSGGYLSLPVQYNGNLQQQQQVMYDHDFEYELRRQEAAGLQQSFYSQTMDLGYEQSAQSNAPNVYPPSQQLLTDKHSLSPQPTRTHHEAFQALHGMAGSNNSNNNNNGGSNYQVLGSSIPKEEVCDFCEMSHEFVFTNLEFQKPSRMGKVYLVFYFTISGLDLIYAMFKIPTICICRAEQRYRAYGMLGIPCYAKSKKDGSSIPDLSQTESNITVMRGGQQLQEMELWDIAVALEHDGSRSGTQQQTATQSSPVYEPVDSSGAGAAFVADAALEQNGVVLQTHCISQHELQDCINKENIWLWAFERYTQTGLQRNLTNGDQVGIFKMATLISTSKYITPEKFLYFQEGFDKILKVLKKFAKYWNYDGDVRCISHLGVGSEEALNILTEECPGTCIIRMAQSSMGSLSVTIVKAVQDESRNMKQVKHYLMTYEQLMSLPNGNLDQWFQNIGVEFIMDPTTKKKFPRENLVTNYTKWEDLQ